MLAAVCQLVLTVNAAAPVPKGPNIAPPPRPLIQLRALHFVTDPNKRFDRRVSYGVFDANGPKESSFQPLGRGIKHLTVDPKAGLLYGIVSHSVYVVPPTAADYRQMTELKLPADLTKLSWPCGITFDTKRERVVLVSLGGKGHMYTFAPKSGKWTELTDMSNLDLAGFTYCPKGDVLFGLYRPLNAKRRPTVGRFDPVNGKLVGEIVLDDAELPSEFGEAHSGEPDKPTVQIASTGTHLLMLTDTQLFRLDLKTNKITVEWKKE